MQAFRDSFLNRIKLSLKGTLRGNFPNFMIFGGQKAATTSLHYYLSQHPKIIGSRPKEVRFFDRDENYERGLKWYKHNFPNTNNPFSEFKYFEATPEYLYRSYVPKRIHALNKGMKIVNDLGLSGYKVVGWIGSFRKYHGVDTVVKSFAQVVHELKTVKLLLIGDGKAAERIVNILNQMKFW